MTQSEPGLGPTRRTVLIVDDDPGTLHVLSSGIGTTLDLFDVVTASDGREAIEVLERAPVDAVVTDLAMPVLDGFALIAHITNLKRTLPVIVLSGLSSSDIDERLERFGSLRVLHKPASYQDVAECLIQTLERVDLGQVEGIPLAGVLQLVESERRSCTVLVGSGRRKGRLYFQSGRLINAFSEDFGADGEAAAYDILGWADTAIAFEPLPDDVRKHIHTPMQLMLIEVAVTQDQLRADTERSIPPASHPDEERDAAMSGWDDDTDTDRSEASSDDAADGSEAPWDDAADRSEAASDDEHHAPPSAQDDAPTHLEAGPDDEPEADAEATPEPGPQSGGTTAAAPMPSASALDTAADERPPASGNGAPDSHAAQPSTLGEREEPDGETHASAPANPHPGTDGEAPEPSVDEAANDASTADPHVAALMEAIARLTQRSREADAALAAVATEVAAFRDAQRAFDEAFERRERRRRELEAFRHDVASLAREILGRVDDMFAVEAADGASSAPTEQPATP